MCLFDFDDVRDGAAEHYELAFSSVRNYVSWEFDGYLKYELFNRYEKLCLLLKCKEPPDKKEMEVKLERIIQRAGRYSETPLSVGVSHLDAGERNFADMAVQAHRALEYRRVIGGYKVFFSGDTNPAPSRLAAPDGAIREIGYNIHFLSAEGCIKNLEDLRLWLEGSRESHHYVVTSTLNVLIKSCDNLDGLYSRYGGMDELYRRFFGIKTDDEIWGFLRELICEIIQLNDCVIVDNVEHSLRKITAYMQAHFCDPDISFDSLASAVGFSISYISALLKKNLNTSFVKMLTSLRMNKAEQLLRDPSLKIIDVAEQLGYNDSYYFSHCFKKHMGISPKEFRNNENRQ
jgi:two-component system response regulator YesN